MNQGFYQVDISTGEKTLLYESKIEDAWGYVFSEDYMTECNRYSESNPNNPCFRFYNGDEWIEIELPEAVKDSDGAFYPMALASDRIFYQHGVKKDGEVVIDWYYFRIDEQNPEFIYIGEIPSTDRPEENSQNEEIEETIKEDTDDFEDIVIFENDEYLCKILNVYIKNSNYCVDVYYENKTDERNYLLGALDCRINGIQCQLNWGIEIQVGDSNIATIKLKDAVENYNISEFYSVDEYTKIELAFNITNGYKEEDGSFNMDARGEKIITIYPKGEENITVYERESLDTDVVLVDNEYVSVILTGYETGFVENDTLNVYLVNKTDDYVQMEIKEASINDFILKTIITVAEAEEIEGIENITKAKSELFYFVMMPNSCAIYEMTLFDGEQYVGEGINDKFFKNNNITNIEEMEIKLRGYAFDYAAYRAVGDELFYKEIILNP